MQPPDFIEWQIFSRQSGERKWWRMAQKIIFETRKGVLAKGGGASEPAVLSRVQMFNMHAVSTTRKGKLTLHGRAWEWQGTLKGNTKRQIVQQLLGIS